VIKAVGNGNCLFQSLTVLLGNNESQHDALSFKVLYHKCIIIWYRFCTYVSQYIRDILVSRSWIMIQCVEAV